MIKRVQVMIVLVLSEEEISLYRRYGKTCLKPILNVLPLYCITQNDLRFIIDQTINIERSGHLKSRGFSERYTCLVTVNGIKGKKFFYRVEDEWYCDV